MTEGEMNLLEAKIANTLERASASRCDGRDAEAVVGARWLASVLVEVEHLKQQRDDLHRSNSVLHAKAEAARAEAAHMRDVVRLGGSGEIETLREDLARAERERDDALAKCAHANDVAAAQNAVCWKIRGALGAVEGEMGIDAACRVMRQLDEARERARVSAEETESLGALFDTMRVERDAAQADLARIRSGYTENARLADIIRDERNAHAETKVARAKQAEIITAMSQIDTKIRDATSACADETTLAAVKRCVAVAGVPADLARLYRAAQKARKKWGAPHQRVKLAEECGEFVVEVCRRERHSDAAVAHEAHDVLTVALSLCEPALMLASAERLEGRLVT
jgi:hypothetical protein